MIHFRTSDSWLDHPVKIKDEDSLQSDKKEGNFGKLLKQLLLGFKTNT